MALGNRIFVDLIDGRHEEGKGIDVNVNWIHTKFMLIDPLGTKPITLTGSANWSVPSVTDNDENVLVTQRQARGRYLLHGVHAAVRPPSIPRVGESPPRRDRRLIGDRRDDPAQKADLWKPKDLLADWDDWVPDQFKPGSGTTSSGLTSRQRRQDACDNRGVTQNLHDRCYERICLRASSVSGHLFLSANRLGARPRLTHLLPRER
jgi:hypothetical protein